MIETAGRAIQIFFMLLAVMIASPASANDRWITHPALQTADPASAKTAKLAPPPSQAP